MSKFTKALRLSFIKSFLSYFHLNNVQKNATRHCANGQTIINIRKLCLIYVVLSLFPRLKLIRKQRLRSVEIQQKYFRISLCLLPYIKPAQFSTIH